MMKKIIIALAVLVLLLVAGCGQKEEEGVTTGRTFIGGTTGLVLDFIVGSPPGEVFDQNQQPFAINVKVENRGEWPINNPADLTMSITGIDPADFNNPTLKQNAPQALQASRLSPEGNILPGSIANFFFEGFSYTGALAGTSQDFTLKADACYKYGTRATTKVCIRENLLTIEPGICMVTEDKLVENSGAPVQIENVKEGALGNDKVSLTFTIKHAGQGSIHERGSACSPVISDKDRVYLIVNTGIEGTTCSGLQDAGGNSVTGSEGFITLFNGERIVNCQQQVSAPGEFEKVVEITAEYDYKQSISTTLKVKKSTV